MFKQRLPYCSGASETLSSSCSLLFSLTPNVRERTGGGRGEDLAWPACCPLPQCDLLPACCPLQVIVPSLSTTYGPSQPISVTCWTFMVQGSLAGLISLSPSNGTATLSQQQVGGGGAKYPWQA